jgi:HD-like signal output (HDOD) protein/DNA-binding NarL/FixJ family response regulator
MSPGLYRALVVDCEAAHQRPFAAALAKRGIGSDPASDYRQANEKLTNVAYDVVIVDLNVPGRRSEPFAVELLARRHRPHVVVLTDLIAPQLAQELIARGADDVLVKPIDFQSLATKVGSLVDNSRQRSLAADGAMPFAFLSRTSAAADDADGNRVTIACLQRKLGEVSQVLPISDAALDVYAMTNDTEWNLSQIAAAVQRDAALTTEVLRMANSAYYNPPGRPISDLDEAVMRIGQRRVGELALSINALSSVTPAMIPWMNLDLLWNRSMAAGIALELLVELGGHEPIADGLFISALMHPLGRVVLAMLFPDEYAEMLTECARTGETLLDVERRRFPAEHADVMAELLAQWRLAPEVFLPLKFSCHDYGRVARLLEPMRTKVELVKVAIVLGRIAVGRWEGLDAVDLPPAAILDRLGIEAVDSLIEQIRSDVAQLADFRPGGKSASRKLPSPAELQTVAYCSFAGREADLLKAFLPALGLKPRACSVSELRESDEPLIANCLDTDPGRFAAQRTDHRSVIFADRRTAEQFARYAPTIALPESFAHIAEKIQRQVARRTKPVEVAVGSA